MGPCFVLGLSKRRLFIYYLLTYLFIYFKLVYLFSCFFMSVELQCESPEKRESERGFSACNVECSTNWIIQHLLKTS